jgi:N-methylhydantoinase A
MFSEAHLRTYGHTMPDPVEIVAIRVSATGQVDEPSLPIVEAGQGAPQPIGQREVYRGSGNRETYEVFDRSSLLAGQVVPGPAIIVEHTSTTVLHGGDSCKIGDLGELIISVEQESTDV